MNKADRAKLESHLEARKRTPRAFYVLEKLATAEVTLINQLGEEHPKVQRLESVRQVLESYIREHTEITVEHALLVMDLLD